MDEDTVRQLAEQVAAEQQAAQAADPNGPGDPMRGLAELIRRYYQALVVAGFAEMEALMLISQYQYALVQAATRGGQ